VANKETTTIVALATPPGTSAIAALRVSGSAVKNVCKTILPNFKMQPRVASLTEASFNDKIIDELIAVFFSAPNSYTGEDVLELFPHGNPFIVRKLIEAICKVPGVRLAERGEFTQRAFLNGKLDLTQAEAVGALLAANNSKSLSDAQRLLSGEISSEINALAESVKGASALLELEVDFAEDTEGKTTSEVLLEHKILQHLQNLKKRFRASQSELPKAALFGAPNAGKSSLINALVKQNRLLVSETPGTTRDFVEVPLHLPSGDILLIDTAGFANKAQNKIDEMAMQKSQEILEKANLKILVTDASAPLPDDFEKLAGMANLAVWTHTDISCKFFDEKKSDLGNFKVASPKGEGIEEFINVLDNIFFPKDEAEELWITSERQIACIEKAEVCALRALELLKQPEPAIELAAFEMREARNALCSITGEISDESILNSIFSSYCIGK
jgi:tRNA modification GTPase